MEYRAFRALQSVFTKMILFTKMIQNASAFLRYFEFTKMILSDLQNKTLSAVWNQFHGNVAVCCAILSQFPCNNTNTTFRIQRNLAPVLIFLVSHTKQRSYIRTTCHHTVTNLSAFMNVDSHVLFSGTLEF